MSVEDQLSLYKRDSFIKALVEIYGCPYLGEGILPPYGCVGDEPDMFRGPEGVFCVPQPTGEKGFYYQWIIDRVIEKNRLVVVTTPTQDTEEDAAVKLVAAND